MMEAGNNGHDDRADEHEEDSIENANANDNNSNSKNDGDDCDETSNNFVQRFEALQPHEQLEAAQMMGMTVNQMRRHINGIVRGSNNEEESSIDEESEHDTNSNDEESVDIEGGYSYDEESSSSGNSVDNGDEESSEESGTDDDDEEQSNGDSDSGEEELFQLTKETLFRLRFDDPDITRLEINFGGDNEYDAQGVIWTSEQMQKCIADNTHLKYLSINGEDFEGDMVNAKAFFKGLAANRSIEHLSTDCVIDSEDMIDILAPFFEQNNCLRSLDVYGFDLDASSGLTTSLSKCDATSLQQLTLSCIGGEDVDAEAVVTSLSIHQNLADLSVTFDTVNGMKWCGALQHLLKSSTSKLERLDLSWNHIDDKAAALLGSGLKSNQSLKEIYLDRIIGFSDGSDESDIDTITPAGWATLLKCLFHQNSALEMVSLRDSNLDSACVKILAEVLTKNTTLKSLNIGELLCHVDHRHEHINDELAIDLANALIHNRSLHTLILGNDSVITEKGWSALANVVCNKSTDVTSIFNSNHTLQTVASRPEGAVPPDLLAYLELNRNENKAEVARQKIINYHFSNGIEELLDMDLALLPHALAWAGRDLDEVSLLFQVVRSSAYLFDTDGKMTNISGSKRKACH